MTTERQRDQQYIENERAENLRRARATTHPMTPGQLPEVPAHYRAQLVAWIEANRQAAINSPQSASWSNGVAKGVELALEYFDAVVIHPSETNSER